MKRQVITFVALILAAALMSACGSAGVEAVSGHDPVKVQIAQVITAQIGGAVEVKVTKPGNMMWTMAPPVAPLGDNEVNLVPLLERAGFVETKQDAHAFRVYLTESGEKEARGWASRPDVESLNSRVIYAVPGIFTVEVERYTKGEFNNVNAEVAITFTPYAELAARMTDEDRQHLTVRRTANLVQFDDGLRLASLRPIREVQVGSL